MEKNCLVTTYKATVNDNSLLKVGEMFIDIIEQESPTNQTNRLYLNTSDAALVVEVENGAANLTLDENMASGWTNKITLQKSEFVPPAPIFVRNGNYRVKVSSKYNLTEVGRWTTNIGQKAISVDTQHLKFSPNMVTIINELSGNLANLKGCTKLTKLIVEAKSSITGSLSDLAPLTALGVLRLNNPSITGSLSYLAPLTALGELFVTNTTSITGSLSYLAPLTALGALNLSGCNNITGSLSDLAPLTALGVLNLGGCNNITGDIKDIRLPLTSLGVYNTQIIGELIEFVKTQRAEGRTTGSCSNTGWWGHNITFNRASISDNAYQILTWTDNTITLGDITVNQ